MFEAIDSNKKYQQVMHQLEELILSKQLKKGDRLPSELELIETLNVSRSSIREAISALSAIGILSRKAKEGTTISCDIELGLCKPLALTYKLDGGKLDDVLFFRYIVEIQVIKIITQKCTDDEFKLLANIVDASLMAQSIEELLELDLEFHKTLVALAGNKLMNYFTQAISHLTKEQMSAGYFKLHGLDDLSMIDFPDFRSAYVENHQSILKGLIQRDRMSAMKHLVDGFEKANPEFDFTVVRLCI